MNIVVLIYTFSFKLTGLQRVQTFSVLCLPALATLRSSKRAGDQRKGEGLTGAGQLGVTIQLLPDFEKQAKERR